MGCEDTNHANIGENVLNLRKEHCLSLRDLSAKSGVSDSQISKIERGVCVPRYKSLQAIATALGVTPADLQGEVAA